MTNITKTTKTLLFAGLIAALILPFSGMMMAEAAPNENASDKAKEKFNYDVEILSKTIISEEIIDGVKVTHFKQQLKQTDFPTMKEFKEMNADYFETLTGKEQGKLTAEFAQAMKDAPEVYEIETVKVGEHSINFEPVTRSWPTGWASEKDPINLVFYDEGNSSTVKSIIDNNISHSWNTATGGGQWTFVDESAHGGSTYWAFGSGYAEGIYNDRYHVRIFSGGDDTHSGGFGEWSIGAAHREYSTNGVTHTHYSNSWEVAENHLAGDLASASGIGVISSINLSNSGSYQGISNNGYAALVQVQ